jgi:hypothetical protein
VLGDRLGATLVESSDPSWKRDPDVEAMTTDFRRALARLVPLIMPDVLFRLGRGRAALFKEFAAAIVPTEFLPGKFFGTGTMPPIDYCVELAEGRITPPRNLDIATIQEQRARDGVRFHLPQYLSRRAEDWKARGFTETLVDFPALNARSKFWGDDQRAAFRNWEEVSDPRNPHGRARASTSASCCASCCAGGHDGHPRKPSGRAGPPAHAVSAGSDRRRLPAGPAATICARRRSTGRTPG